MLGFITIFISEDFTASVSSGLSIEDVLPIQISPATWQQSRARTPKWDEKYSLYNQQEALHVLLIVNTLKMWSDIIIEVFVPSLIFFFQCSNLRLHSRIKYIWHAEPSLQHCTS